MLQWARAQKCPWLEDDICANAASGGHLEILRWLREVGCRWGATSYFAAGGGHLAVLKWLRERNCSWDASTCRAATVGGHLAVLRWAREHGCEWNEIDIRAVAAVAGHKEVLNRLDEHGE